jgi:hypothetical protein
VIFLYQQYYVFSRDNYENSVIVTFSFKCVSCFLQNYFQFIDIKKSQENDFHQSDSIANKYKNFANTSPSQKKIK